MFKFYTDREGVWIIGDVIDDINCIPYVRITHNDHEYSLMQIGEEAHRRLRDEVSDHEAIQLIGGKAKIRELLSNAKRLYKLIKVLKRFDPQDYIDYLWPTYSGLITPEVGTIQGIVYPSCGETKLIWWCADCTPLNNNRLTAGCPQCGNIFTASIPRQSCPDEDRHNCCEVHPVGNVKDDPTWLPVKCSSRYCYNHICICHRAEARDCGSML